MKIIVCGAGNLGKSVVSYLVKGNNDIVVIDDNQRNLDEISKEFDVLPIVGKPSHPDVLERAGAKDCDMIFAVTDTDEVNMIVCQLAYTLFTIPKKIASINSKTFLDPLWAMLYNDNHLPVDLLISPDIDIADNILKILKYPGCSGIISVLNEDYCILTVNIKENCPFLNVELMQVTRQEGINPGFVNIVRNNQSFLPDMYETLQLNDEVNILLKTSDIYSTISAFGLEKPTNERLVVFGGNEIAEYIGGKIEHDDTITSCRLIEEDIEKARKLAKILNHVVVINGEMMSDVILKEAEINRADAVIALTDDDKDNLLASLLASKNGVTTTISVINTPSYNNLMFSITDNILVDRSAVTISKILKEIRTAKLKKAYSVSREQGEIWEIRLNERMLCCYKKIGELNLAKNCRVFAILRDGNLIYPDQTTKLEDGDLILVYVDSTAVKQSEQIFS